MAGETAAALNLIAAWLGMGIGAVYGSVLGLFFHEDQWLGGYGSFRRRLLRLGHIACFGLAFVNMAFYLTVLHADPSAQAAKLASVGFLAAAAAMPLACIAAAINKELRVLFPIPVGAFLLGVGATLAGLYA